MAVAFKPGQTLGRDDLNIFLNNAAGNPSNAAEITFAIYYVDPGPPEVEVLIGSSARTPSNPAVGEYYAPIQIPPSATAGDYRIRWTFKEFVSSPDQMVVQEFAVVASSSLTTSTMSACEQDLVDRLRVLLRDNNPDANYRFRPPEGEGVVGCFNQVFGYIWQDEELLQYLEIALMKWNSFPPETEELSSLDTLCSKKPAWRAAVLWGGIVNAAMALSFNWVADEFSYSIGGISLDIEKSSKYQSLKENAEQQFEKLTEAKARTTKYLRGLRQSRYSPGVRSAFGPAVGRGVLSPRKFL